MSYTNSSYNRTSNDGSTVSSGNIFAIANQIAPIYPLYIRDKSGNIRYDANGLRMFDYGNKANAGLERPYLPNTNALSALELDTNNGEGNAFYSSGFADIVFLNDFKFTTMSSAIVDENRRTTVTNPFYGTYASSNGIVSKTHDRRFIYDSQQLLTWSKNIDIHNISVLVGHHYHRSQYYYLWGSKQNMFDPGNHELNGAVTAGTAAASYTTDYNTESLISRLMYDYDGKYFGNFSYSRAATSRFHADNRWGNFWAAGVAWEISREHWLADMPWINMLKLKASYGEMGNDDIGNYRYTDTYNIINSNGRPAAVPNQKGNKDISWETVSDFNTGIDFSLFRERFSGTIEYYYRKRSDMLFSFPLPPSLGWTSFFDNIGDMRNRGIEVELRGDLINTRDLIWSARVNMAANKNKILRLPEERKTLTAPCGTEGYTDGNTFIGEGVPLRSFYMIRFAGLNESGQATYYRNERDEDGNFTDETTIVLNPADATQYLCGSPFADLIGGFGTSLQYKGFDFSVDFAYQLGGLANDIDYFSAMNNPLTTTRGRNFHADLLNAWTPENTTSNIPRFQFGDQFANSANDRSLTSASFLSLHNISFGYTLPRRVCKFMGVEKLRFYAVCDNAWFWSKRQGLDPRQRIDGGRQGFEMTSSLYAPIRSFSGGVSISF